MPRLATTDSSIHARRARLALGLDQALRGVPVDDRRDPQQDHERRIPRRVEEVARDQQVDLLRRSSRAAGVQREHEREEHDERQRVEDHAGPGRAAPCGPRPEDQRRRIRAAASRNVTKFAPASTNGACAPAPSWLLWRIALQEVPNAASVACAVAPRHRSLVDPRDGSAHATGAGRAYGGVSRHDRARMSTPPTCRSASSACTKRFRCRPAR